MPDRINYATYKTLLPYLSTAEKVYVHAVMEKEDDRFPCTFSMIHNDREIRARFILNNQGSHVIVHMPIDVFNNLPIFVRERGAINA